MYRHLALPILLIAAGCSAGAQQSETSRAEAAAGQRDFNVGAFDSVALAGHHDVVVTVGGAHSVRAEGDSEAIERLDIRVEDGALKIGNRERSGFRIFGGRQRPVTVYVTAPSLRSAAVAGSGDMRIDRAESESFQASLAGSGDLTIEALRAGTAAFSVAGSGSIRAAGAVQRSSVSIAGSGDVDLRALETRGAEVSVMGSGNVQLHATETADVSIMGSGDVEVVGGARCSVRKNGSGGVRCG